MEDAVSNVASSGVLGALVVILAAACAWLARRLGEVQEARVTDAQKVAEAALAREEKWQGVLTDLTNAVERITLAPQGRPR